MLNTVELWLLLIQQFYKLYFINMARDVQERPSCLVTFSFDKLLPAYFAPGAASILLTFSIHPFSAAQDSRYKLTSVVQWSSFFFFLLDQYVNMLILTYHLYEYFRVSGQQAMNVLGIHLSSNVIYFIFRKLQETQMSTSSKLEESEHRVQVLQAGLTTL